MAKIGLVAGQGELPIVFAKKAKEIGMDYLVVIQKMTVMITMIGIIV